MKLTFGKYKGFDLEDIPTDYLSWISSTHDNESLKNACANELLRRKEPTKGITSKMIEAEFMSKLAALLEQMPDKLFGKEMFLKTITGHEYIFKVERTH